MTEEVYKYWFACLRRLASGKKCRLYQCMGSEEAVYYIEEKKLAEFSFLSETDREYVKNETKKGALTEDYERFLELDIKLITMADRAYPGRLKNIAAPPWALFVKGSLPEEDLPAAAIIGARQCTPYGERMAIAYGEKLAEAGIPVISGMARGVDSAGQRGALNRGGRTYAVLGSGADVCYPRENRGLYLDIQKEGGIISEQPPGVPPFKENFPARNRIISALSDMVLVMEAKERSGSLITADFALEQGKDVCALPGPVTSSFSRGCNLLIQQGAGLLLKPEDFVEDLRQRGIVKNKEIEIGNGKKSDKNEKMLESPENIVYSCLGLYPKGIDSLLAETKMEPRELMEALVSLELKGMILEISRHYYSRVK